VNANSLQQNIIVINEICSWLPPFCKQNILLQPRLELRRTYFFNHYNCFDEFAFTVQVKHKINSVQILGFILICLYFTFYFMFLLVPAYPGCPGSKAVKRSLLLLLLLYFTTGHFHTCTLQRMSPISLLILGSLFSDCVVFYGDTLQQTTCNG